VAADPVVRLARVTEVSLPDKFKVAVKGGGLSMETEVDGGTARAIVNLLMGGEGVAASPPPPTSKEEDGGGNSGRGGSARRGRRAKQDSGSSGKGDRGKGHSRKAKRRQSVGLVKDLSLRPKGKKSFKDFADEKKPTNHNDKVTVCVFWLSKEAGQKATAEHVNTCYQGADWKRPTDLRDTLRQTASKKGWIDTADSDDIKVTTSGEDHVRHDLPEPAKK
jgi:hypothetical protein